MSGRLSATGDFSCSQLAYGLCAMFARRHNQHSESIAVFLSCMRACCCQARKVVQAIGREEVSTAGRSYDDDDSNSFNCLGRLNSYCLFFFALSSFVMCLSLLQACIIPQRNVTRKPHCR
eukprot:6214638-Pleurochrysis_carterae.AAC.5